MLYKMAQNFLTVSTVYPNPKLMSGAYQLWILMSRELISGVVCGETPGDAGARRPLSLGSQTVVYHKEVLIRRLGDEQNEGER